MAETLLTCCKCKRGCLKPWRGCARGHLMCDPCFAALATGKATVGKGAIELRCPVVGCNTLFHGGQRMPQLQLEMAMRVATLNKPLLVPCPFLNCEARVAFETLEQHAAQCEWAIVKCLVSDCTFKGTRQRLWNEHYVRDKEHDAQVLVAEKALDILGAGDEPSVQVTVGRPGKKIVLFQTCPTDPHISASVAVYCQCENVDRVHASIWIYQCEGPAYNPPLLLDVTIVTSAPAVGFPYTAAELHSYWPIGLPIKSPRAAAHAIVVLPDLNASGGVASFYVCLRASDNGPALVGRKRRAVEADIVTAIDADALQ